MLPDFDQRFEALINDHQCSAVGHEFTGKVFHSAAKIIDTAPETNEFILQFGPLADQSGNRELYGEYGEYGEDGEDGERALHVMTRDHRESELPGNADFCRTSQTGRTGRTGRTRRVQLAWCLR